MVTEINVLIGSVMYLACAAFGRGNRGTMDTFFSALNFGMYA